MKFPLPTAVCAGVLTFFTLAACGGGGSTSPSNAIPTITATTASKTPTDGSLPIIALTNVPSANASSQGTGYPYDPMNPNTEIAYAVFLITQGRWHQDAMQLDVAGRTPLRTNTLSFSSSNCPAFFGQGPLYRATYDHNDQATLQDGGWVVSGKAYIGEAINSDGNVQIPFIGKLTQSPIAGERLSATSTIYNSCDQNSVIEYLPWTYQTIAHYATWGNFTDVWRTGLLEKNSLATYGQGTPFYGQDRVYNYVFQKGVGLVNFWYGYVQPDGTIYYNPDKSDDPKNGLEYYAISHN